MVAAVEVDATAAETYRLNHREVLLFDENILEITPRRILRKLGLRKGEVTVVLGCPPCQGFSRQRRGGHDERNKLVRVFAEFVSAIKPQVFVLENVPGLAKGVGKRIFKDALETLGECGYSVVHGILNAADYGVPQRRRRVVAIGSLNGSVSLPTPSHCSPMRLESDRDAASHLKPWSTVRNSIGNLPRLSSGKADTKDPLHLAPKHGEKALKRLRSIPRNGGSRSHLPRDLVLKCHKKHDGHKDVYGRMKWDDVAPTITGGCDRVSKGRFAHPEQNRGITMREAALLQTFPQGYRFSGGRSAIALQLGNAVPMMLAGAIARHVRNSVVLSGAAVSGRSKSMYSESGSRRRKAGSAR